jgi:hypothetical protein
MKRICALSAFFALLVGCQSSDTFKVTDSETGRTIVIPLEKMRHGPAVAAGLQAEIDRLGKVTFASTNTQRIADGSSEITLSRDHQAEFTQFGIGVFTHKGTFSIGADGLVAISFEDAKIHLPPLILMRDDVGFALLPSDMKSVGGIPGWPFRSVSPG